MFVYRFYDEITETLGSLFETSKDAAVSAINYLYWQEKRSLRSKENYPILKLLAIKEKWEEIGQILEKIGISIEEEVIYPTCKLID